MDHEPIVEQEELDLGYILRQFSSRWYWFIIGGLVCGAIALNQTNKAVPTHQISSSVLFKIDEDRTIYNEDVISGLNFMYRSKTVENEIAVLRSRQLIGRVIDSLDLNVSVFRNGKMNDELYICHLPFMVSGNFDDVAVLEGKPISLKFISESAFQIRYNDNELGKFEMNDPIAIQGFEFYLCERDVAEKIDLIDTELDLYFDSKSSLIQKYKNSMTVYEMDMKTHAVTIDIEETLADRGKDFMNNLLELYVIQIIEDRKRIAQNTYDFIDERLRINFGHLDSLEFQIERYKSSRNLSDPNLEAKYILQGIKKFEIELNDAQTQLDIVQNITEMALSDSRMEMDFSIPNTMLGVTDPLLNDMMVDLNRKQYQLRTLRKTVQVNNPMYQELQAEVNDLRESIMIDLLNMKDNMVTTTKYIEDQIADYKRQLSLLNVDEKDLTSMERIKNNKEQLYIYLLKKREEAAMILASELLDTWVIENPHISGFFYFPKRSIVIISGLFIGIFLPTCLILLMMLLDDKVRKERDVRKILSEPIIGRVHWRRGKSKDDRYIGANLKQIEQFKKLSYNLRATHGEYTSLLFNSMMSGDGKTFSAYNTALTLARMGQKTCIIELDLRRPEFENHFGWLKNNGGIIDYLDGHASREEILQSSPEQAKLSIVKAGQIPADPTKYLAGDGLREFIKSLYESYDKVILDTAPIGIVTDALAICDLVDVNLFVIRQDVSSKSHIEEMRTLIEENHIYNAGLILNGTRLVTSKNYLKYDEYMNERHTGWQKRLRTMFKPQRALNWK